ncbi:hypothetical protein RvY_12255-1 [Ramazzottius varieornatus]|uniref:Uncharacterized protein n=1 Tax=Ramazzottius varieornatus TaxID=947166 RepID=A0A1D1VN35_RAMVA|nr:hypothetical protein RvY_12255-1 [Ramazzottius varieornatus]
MLAVSAKESGAWLHALPAACLGNLLNDDALRISVGVRLGAPLCEAHTCRSSAQVDIYGRHGLSCKYSAGRHSRHSSLNESIKRVLVSCQIPTILEPNGILRDNSVKRPDGITQIPWKEGKALVWDVTCVDALCQTYVAGCSDKARYAAERAEGLKVVKYTNLEGRYFFSPVGFKVYGTFRPAARDLLYKIGKKMRERTGEKRSSEFLRQRVSIDTQRDNSACVLSTFPHARDLEEVYFVLDI